MSINSRIEKLVDYYCKGNITEFSTNIGLPNNVTIHRLVNSETKPSYKVMVMILQKYSDISPGWLLLGELPMFRTGSGEVSATQPEAEADGGDVGYLKQIISQQQEMISALKDHIATLKKEQHCGETKKSKAV